MPHYPDEIEYSDKYLDDHYEYRHVILPKDVYRKIPRNRLLTESVLNPLFRNGEQSESSNLEGGCTTSFTVPSPTFCCSAEPRVLIPKLVFPLPVSSLLPTPSTDLINSAYALSILSCIKLASLRSAFPLKDLRS